MRGFGLLAAVVCVAIGTGVAIVSARPVTGVIGAPTTAGSYVTPPDGRTGRITVGGACPAVFAFDDVRNTLDVGPRLLPPRPTAALLCRYETARSGTRLPVESQTLGAGAATDLDVAVDILSTKVPEGIFHCPAAFAGDDVVLAFSFAGRDDVDLFYEDTGCQRIDNGQLAASSITDPVLFEAFSRLIGHFVPASS